MDNAAERKIPKLEPQPSETLREAVTHIRRLAIAMEELLPIAAKIERIAERQKAYEQRITRELSEGAK